MTLEAISVGGPAAPVDLDGWADLAPAGTAPSRTIRDIEAALDQFETVDLDGLNEAVLLDRTDTKYLTTADHVLGILQELTDRYRVLVVRGRRRSHYRTLYLDTPDFDLYLQHHNRRVVRSKVRSREYIDSGARFFEVKRRNAAGRTVKTRARCGALVSEVVALPDGFEVAPLPDPADLQPALLNAFSRLTLVRRDAPERVTIDLDLRFAVGARTLALPGVAIVELKQDGIDRGSPLYTALRRRGIRPTGFSKYCTGIALLCDHVKHNNFKPQLRRLSEITRGRAS